MRAHVMMRMKSPHADHARWRDEQTNVIACSIRAIGDDIGGR
jgi:hypothetical protein